MRNQLIALTILGLLLVLGSCRTQVDRGEKPANILMVYTDWTESIAMTYLAQILLERDLNYTVDIKLAGIDAVFKDIATANADVFVDAWISATHREYSDLYVNKIETLGPNYTKARTGLVVPNYMEVESIEDLPSVYNGPIVGIDSAAGIMQNAQIAIDTYLLENELLVSSDAEMAEKLQDAIKRRENIVVTGWEPHWLFHRYTLRYLNDPKGVFMAEEEIHTIARLDFSNDHPQAAKFFERMMLTERQINSLLYEMRLNQDPLEGVNNWIKKNEFIVNQWTKDLGKERTKIM